MKSKEQRKSQQQLEIEEIRGLISQKKTHRALRILVGLFPYKGPELLDEFAEVDVRFDQKKIDIDMRNREFSRIAHQALEMINHIK